MDKIVGNIVGLPSPRSDWMQTDKMKADFVKNKPSIRKSDISEYSMMLNNDNSSGLKAYYVKSIDIVNKKIYLSNTQYTLPEISDADYTDTEFNTPGYAIGDAFDLIVKPYSTHRMQYHFISNITSIQNNVIGYDTELPVAEFFEDSEDYSNTFFVSTKPHIGVVDIGGYSNAGGQFTFASGKWSHAEGFGGIAAGMYSHVEGCEGRAAYASHSEGHSCHADGNYSHAEGNTTKSLGDNSHSEGKLTESHGLCSHSEGQESKAKGDYSHSEGMYSTAEGKSSHSEGQATHAKGSQSHSEGQSSVAEGVASHAEGYGSVAKGRGAHSEGGKDNSVGIDSTTAEGDYSHAEGLGSLAKGKASHAEGLSSVASGYYSHAENKATASGEGSHAEASSTSSGVYAHAEGEGTTASGKGAHSEGKQTMAVGAGSHAEGYSTESKASYSHAEGRGTIASGHYQHVQGRYNVEDTSATSENPQGTYAHIVGNGTGTTKRKNIHTLDWDGNAWFQGTVEATAIILKSSTSGSSKRFKITVDDNGTLKTTAI